MYKPVSFVVPRYHEDDAICYYNVSAQIEDGCLENPANFKTAIEKAVTEWIINTDDGRDAWDNSDWLFNLGDLMEAQGDSDLCYFLKKEGIVCLQISVVQVEPLQIWDYEDLLPDRQKMESEGVRYERI